MQIGVSLMGYASLLCRSDGTWSGGFPQCIEGTLHAHTMMYMQGTVTYTQWNITCTCKVQWYTHNETLHVHVMYSDVHTMKHYMYMHGTVMYTQWNITCTCKVQWHTLNETLHVHVRYSDVHSMKHYMHYKASLLGFSFYIFIFGCSVATTDFRS